MVHLKEMAHDESYAFATVLRMKLEIFRSLLSSDAFLRIIGTHLCKHSRGAAEARQRAPPTTLNPFLYCTRIAFCVKLDLRFFSGPLGIRRYYIDTLG